METKMVQNKTEKETTPATLTPEKQPAPSERPLVRRRSRRRLPAW